MPKQLILLIKHKNKYRVILSDVRENRKRPLFTVVRETIITHWVYPKNRSQISKEIVSCLDIQKYKPKDMRDLYKQIHDNLVSFERKALLLNAGPFDYLLSTILNIDKDDQEYLLEYIKSYYTGETYRPPKSRKNEDIYAPQAQRETIPHEL
jgi:hypothetical protein